MEGGRPDVRRTALNGDRQRQAHADQAAAARRGQGPPELLDAAKRQLHRVGRRRIEPLEAPALEHGAGEVDQKRVDGAAAQLDADRVGAGGVEAEHGGGLPALPHAPSRAGDQPLLLERLDDLADRVLGEAQLPGEVGPGRLAESAQHGQQAALVELPHGGGVAALAGRDGGKCLLIKDARLPVLAPGHGV